MAIAPGATKITVPVRPEIVDERLVLHAMRQAGVIFERILSSGDDSLTLNFCGSKYNNSMKELFLGATFACGGKRAEFKDGNVTHHGWDSSLYIYLECHDKSPYDARYFIRNAGFFSGGLQIIADQSSPERLVLTTKKSCKLCRGHLIGRTAIEWSVCNSCHEICEHTYKEGIGHSGGNIVWLPYCTICGRGDPDWQASEDPFEDMSKAVSKTGDTFTNIVRTSEGSFVIDKEGADAYLASKTDDSSSADR